MSKRAREDETDPYRYSTSTDSMPDTPLTPSPAPAPASLPLSKIAHLSASPANSPLITCSLPGHVPVTFSSYGAYESHYTQAHTNRCQECRRNFPSAHILALHIGELHDSMVAVLRDRGEKTYACFVEECEKKCASPAKRNAHLVARHGFPENYDFAITKNGIDGKTSLLRAEKSERGGRYQRGGRGNPSGGRQERGEGEATEVNDEDMPDGDIPVETAVEEKDVKDENTKDVDMDCLAGAMSSLKFVPHSVRFGRGRGKGRGGFSRS